MNIESTQFSFARTLLSIISEDLRGDGNRHLEEDEDLPRNLFPAGNLGAASKDLAKMDDFRITEYVPSSVGFLFRIRPDPEGSLKFSFSLNVFYPRMPSLAELRVQVAKYENGFPRTEAEWSDSATRSKVASNRLKFRPIYMRRGVESKAALEVSSLVLDGTYHDIPTSPNLDSSLESISAEVAENDTCLRVSARGAPPSELLGSSLIRQEALDDALSKYSARSTPQWKAGLGYRAWKDQSNGDTVVEVLLSNRTSAADSLSLSGRGQDAHLFNPKLSVTAPRELFSPFELAALRSKNYRVNSTVYSTGINCDVEEKVTESAIALSTESLPVYNQMRRFPARIKGYELGSPSPSELAENPLPHLRRVSDYLHNFSHWWKTRAFEELVKARKVPDGVKPEFLSAQLDFEQEIIRYDAAVDLLSKNDKLMTAFRLMNKSFSKNPATTVKSWRVFQLVFIVSSLQELVRRVEHQTVKLTPTVLWYPTGGGKTEAYLGLAVTCAFWDRLRGKSFGTAAWTKFPLRLLSIQQLGRIQNAVCFADLVRMEAPEIPDANRGDKFSVGLYAGGSNSSNDLDWPNDASKETSISFEGKELKGASANPRALLKNHKIDRCPMCSYRGYSTQGSIKTTFDESIPGFRHICGQCGYQLTLYVSDTETIRFLPTLIVSTIDKLAELGQDNANKILFGYAKWKCPTHGYFMQSATGKCNVLKCGRGLESVEGAMDPCPEIVVQDEMHFLRENLGAFDSHYETMMLAIMRRARSELGDRHGGPWNIVGSSATIEGYKDQVAELYCAKDATRFPVPGPANAIDAYSSESDEVQRFVMGFRPQNMSHVDAVMKVLRSFHRLTLRLADPKNPLWDDLGEPFKSMPNSARIELIRYYRTSLTYALLKTEAGQIHKSFIGQLNQILAREGAPQFEEHRIPNLTGEADATEVANVLHRLEKDSPEWVQAVTATSIISHGVDLEILNFLAFRGQPHTVSEWIQTMSRVGRKPGYPAIVINVYNPNRERDAAYFTHHKKYIEHAENLIRTVPITRFSPEALRKTIRGLFYNILAYYTEPGFRYYYRDAVKNAMPQLKGFVHDLLRDYYVLNGSPLSPKESRLLQTLEAELDYIIALLEDPSQDSMTRKTIRPMTSLRDVDEPVLIVPDYDADFFRGS